MSILLLLSSLSLLGCKDRRAVTDTADVLKVDNDADGFTEEEGDCNDGVAAINPAAGESCDYLDNDCDGVVDEDTTAEWFLDGDGDGYGDPEGSAVTCEQPLGYISRGGDCDDGDGSRNPGIDEVCDGVDQDCDDLVDEGVLTEWFADLDGDGMGDPETGTQACSAPAEHVDNDFDCDDGDAQVNELAVDGCDGVDNDCDGAVDEAPDVLWYRDADSDGAGDSEDSVASCEQPSGYVGAGEAFDCDDDNVTVGAGAYEYCDGVDNDCDGEADEADALDAGTWYDDLDGDGYGDDSTAQAACEQPSGTVDVGGDCADSDGSLSPETLWYADSDGDGYGDAATPTASCTQPSGYVADDSDFDDSDAAAWPGATEVCDGVDNDGDGEVDEADAADVSTFYLDYDGDGYGRAGTTTTGCSAPSGYVADSSDCEDTDAAINPGALELCDGDDNDCDGSTDESDAADASTWYADSDLDGYGDAATSQTACTAPSGYVSDDSDCDDAAAAVNPGEAEICDAIDNDCDGSTDESDASDADTWYLDSDSDGYGRSTTSTTSCSQPSGYEASSTDCDDGDSAINPAASEVCDGADNDCDGETDEDDATDVSTWYLDSDGDGYGDASDSLDACDQPSGYVADNTDSDDESAETHPGASEVCDGLDNDGDSNIDESASDMGTWYVDADSDGYGDPATSTTACDAPSGYVADNTDCDDGDAVAYPGATEYCDDTDNDCDGTIDGAASVDLSTWYYDRDGDGYGRSDTTADACDQPSGYVSDSTDCDDDDADVNPGATEVCDDHDVDEDCNGYADDDDSGVTGLLTFYDDGDGDGYGDSTLTTSACEAPSGYVDVDGDCDAYDSSVHPGATEICDDGIDNDCDGSGGSCGLGGSDLLVSDAVASINGTVVGGSFSYTGSHVLFLDDMDSDGYDELVVSSEVNGGYYRGRVYIFDGPLSGALSSEGDADTLLAAVGSHGYFGTELGGGDVDGDGVSDLLVGAPYYNNSAGSDGTVFIYYGPPADGSEADADLVVQNDSTSVNMDQVAVGDVDGDGNADLVLGAWGDSSDPGDVYLFLGPVTADLVAGSDDDTHWDGGVAADYAGADVALADVNGDGLDDLWVGAPRDDDLASQGGSAMLVHGPASVGFTWGPTSAAAYVRGTTSSGYLGEFLGSAGDFNGDGYEDLLLGAPGAGTEGGGELNIFYGPITGTLRASHAEVSINGEHSSDELGTASAVDDIDGDGNMDLAVGALYISTCSGSTCRGRAHIYYGPITGSYSTTDSDGTVGYAGSGSNNFGRALDLGDSDGDGYPDLAVGAYSDTSGGGSGMTYLFAGSGI